MRQRRSITLRYRQGQQVWCGSPHGGIRGEVLHQRVTWRTVLGPVIEYLVQASDGTTAWWGEPDIGTDEEDGAW